MAVLMAEHRWPSLSTYDRYNRRAFGFLVATQFPHRIACPTFCISLQIAKHRQPAHHGESDVAGN